MNKKETLKNVLIGETGRKYTPAAFFLHFNPVYHKGQAAIDKHLDFFSFY
jgi:hypothetical protein